MGKLIPIILAVIGLGAGIGGGIALRPAPVVAELVPCVADGAMVASTVAQKSEAQREEENEANSTNEYVKLNNQFIIPDLEQGRVSSMVVLSLSIETKSGGRETIYLREPKLRDSFNQVLFDHANTGGFKGEFTESAKMTSLRNALREAAQRVVGDVVVGVLIQDIVRQDLS